MLREEGPIHSNKEQEEVSLSMMLGVLAPGKLPYPEIESTKDTKDPSHTQHIMKVRYHVVSHNEGICAHSLCYHKDRTLSSQNI